MTQLFNNNATSTLAAAITAAATTVTLAAGDGAKFPNPQAGDDFLITVFQRVGTSEQNWEIMLCSSRAGDVLTVTRAQEGTTARAYGAGDFVECRLTAAAILPMRAGALTGALNEAATVTIASAASVAIGAAKANTINLTGTTAITAFDAAPIGAFRRTYFAGAMTLTHNAASMILIGGANIVTVAGDFAEWISLGSGNWRMTAYTRASGDSVGTVSLAKGGTGATTAAGALANLGIPNVENKSSATIRGELTAANVTTALNYTPPVQAPGFAYGAANLSMKALDYRVASNPMTALGYASGGRFRFGSQNDVDGTQGYADIIDLSTYTDSTGGGVNALYLNKNSHYIVHKWAPAGQTTWNTKTIAYTDSNITGNAATATLATNATNATTAATTTGNAGTATKLQTARTINGTAFDGTANIQLNTPNAGADGNAVLLASGTDLNAWMWTGFYRGQGLVNAPAANTGWFYVMVESHDNSWTKQTATAYGSGNTANEIYVRSKINGATWLPWVKIADGTYNADHTLKIRAQHYGSDNTNSLDSVQKPEMGFIYPDSPNSPGIGGAFMTFGGLNSAGAGGYTANYMTQIVSSYNNANGRVFFRSRNDDANTWNPWREFWHTGNLVPDTASTANTIVKRDGSGYITGSYVWMGDEGVNGTAGTVTGLIAKRGDNYYRTTNAASVKTFLGLANFTVGGAINPTDNLNPLVTAGLYYLNGLPINAPLSDGQLLVLASPAKDTVAQIVTDYSTGRMYLRTANQSGANWTAWRKQAWADNDTFSSPTLNTAAINKPTIKGYIEQFQALNPGAAVTVNPDNGTLIEISTTANITITLPASVAGMSYTLIIYYNGAHTVTFAGGSTIKWAGGTAPTATSVNAKMDKYVFTCGSWYTLAQDGGRNF